MPQTTSQDPGVAGGRREYILDKITTVEPEATPFLSSIRKISGAKSTTVETLVDDLRPARKSGTKEGEKATKSNNKAKNRAKVKNNVHRWFDEWAVGEVQSAIAKNGGQAAVNNEAGRAKAKMITEGKRDMEAILLSDNTPNEGTSDDDMRSRGAFDWHSTAGGAGNLLVPEGYRTPAGNNIDHSSTTTNALFTEDAFNKALKNIKSQHGSKQTLQLYCGNDVQETVDNFSRIQPSSTNNRYLVNQNADSHEINLTVTIFDSSFARVELIPDEFVKVDAAGAGTGNAGVLAQSEYWELHFMEDLVTEDHPDDEGAGPWGWARAMFASLNLNPLAGGIIYE
tara:strand:+ start:275 stop:1294 length:1020 start_codon:yes stop_codon:yes gene_type:complete